MIKKYLLIAFFFSLISKSFSQGNFNSLATGNWSAAGSWTLASGTDADGVPDSDDNVTIISTHNITVDVSSACNNFTISVSTATITISAGNTLGVMGALSITRGTVAGATGILACSGAASTVTLGNTTGGPTINSIVNFDSPSIYFTRTTFNAAVNMIKSAGSIATNYCRGGNTFNSSFTFTNAAGDDTDPDGDFYFGTNLGDPTDVFNGRTIINLTGYARIRIPSKGTVIFNGVATFNSNGIGAGSHDRIQIARLQPSATTTFNDSVYCNSNSATSDLQISLDTGTVTTFNGPLTLNNTNAASAAAFTVGQHGTVNLNNNVILNCIATSGAITFISGNGYCNLASGKTLTVGASGFSTGNLYIYHLIQTGATAQSLALSGTSSITVGNTTGGGCTFPGNFTSTSSTATIKNNTFGGNLTNSTTTGGATISTNSVTGNVTTSTTTSTTLTSNTISGNLSATATTSATLTSNNITGTTNISTTTSTSQTTNTFGGAYTCSSATITLNTNTFNNTATFTNNGTGGGVWGGNHFNNTLSVTNTSSGGSIQMSQSPSADVYTNTVTVNNTNSGNVVLSRLYDTSYPENIIISNTGSGGIYFGNGGGSSTLANGKILSVGTFNNGLLNLKEFLQIGGTAQNITTTGTATVTLGNANNSSCSFDADLTISCASTVTIDTATFKNNLTVTGAQVTFIENNVNTVGGTCTLTKTGTSDDINGGNIFNRAVTLNNNCTTTGFFRFSDLRSADIFNSTLTVSSAGSDGVRLSRTYNTIYNDNIVLNNTGTGSVAFGTNGGSSTLVNTKTITCGTYNNGTLTFRKFYQIGSTSQSIVTTGSGAVTFGGANTSQCTFDADIIVDCASTLIVDSVLFKANTTITGKSSTYTDNVFNSVSGTTSITKTYGSTATNTCGNNQFKQNVTIVNNTGGAFRFGSTPGPDIFSGDLTLNNTGTGTLSMGYSQTGNTIAGNLNISSSSTGITRFGEGAASNTTTIAGTTTAASGNFTGGSLILNYFTQSGTGANNLLLTSSGNTLTVTNSTLNGDLTTTIGTGGTATTTFTSSNFNRNVNVTSIAIRFVGNSFNATAGTTSITRTGTNNDDTNGNNTFNRATTITCTAATSGRIRFGSNTAGDNFLSTLSIVNQGTDTIAMSHSMTNNIYSGNIDITNTGANGVVRFGQSGTAGTFNTLLSASINATSGNFTNGALFLRCFSQTNAAATSNLLLTGNANMTISRSDFVGGITSTCNQTTTLQLTTFAGTNNFTSTSFIVGGTALGNTFNGTTAFNRTGGTNDGTEGNNTHNAPVTFTNSGTGGYWRLGITEIDDYNASATFIQTGTSVLAPAYAFACTFSGDISTVGTTNAITFASNATGSVVIDGSGPQVLYGSNTYQPTFKTLTMAHTGGAGVGLTLNVTLNIGTTATFTTGYIFSDPISVSTNILNFVSTSTVTGASNLSYVDGAVRKTGTQAFVFPVGKTSITGPKYRYIAMSATGGVGKLASDHFTAEYFNLIPNILYDVTLKDPTIVDLSNYEYWILNKTNGVAAVSTSVTLSWDNPVSNVIAPLALTDVIVARWNTTMWKDHGASGGTGTGSIAANGSGSVTSSSAITTFSPFTLGFKKTKPLPVELLNFDAKPKNNKTVELTWSTASEKNNDKFIVEKSADGINFEQILVAKGKGTTSSTSNYTAYDTQPFEGLNYYRLKQIDFDGKFIYSEKKTVKFVSDEINNLEFAFYPNPITTGERLNIIAKGLLSEKSILVMLNDASGKQVYSKIVLSDTKGNLQTAIDIESKLAPGIYFIVVVSDDKIYNHKLMIK